MQDPQDILREGAETYEQKNADYGRSWYAIGEILYGLTGGEPITLETADDFVSFGLFTRRLDKLARAFSGEFLSDEMNFEGIEDSHADAATYAAMHASIFNDGQTITYENEGDVEPAFETAYQKLRAGGDE